MRRLIILLAGILVTIVFMLLGVQNTTSAPNATATRTPTTTRTDPPALVDLHIDHIYYHSTGLFSIPRLVGWEPTLKSDIVTVPTLSDDTATVYVDFRNDSVLSVVRVALERPAGVHVNTIQDLSRYLNNQYLGNSFSMYER